METGLNAIDTGEMMDELIGIGENELAIPQAILLRAAPGEDLWILRELARQKSHVVGTGQVAWVAIRGW